MRAWHKVDKQISDKTIARLKHGFRGTKPTGGVLLLLFSFVVRRRANAFCILSTSPQRCIPPKCRVNIARRRNIVQQPASQLLSDGVPLVKSRARKNKQHVHKIHRDYTQQVASQAIHQSHVYRVASPKPTTMSDLLWIQSDSIHSL